MKTLLKFLLAVALFGAPALAQSGGGGTPAVPGQTATCTVTNDGTPPFTYQWQKNGTAIPGATAASYVISAVAATDAGSYTVVVANPAGSVTSSAAVLTVISKPTTATASVAVH